MPELISIVGKQRAEETINKKIDVLKRWVRAIPWRALDDGQPLRDRDGELVLEYFPTSISAFTTWDGSQNSKFVRESEHLEFRGPSRGTLDQPYHSASKSLVISLFETLLKRAQRQLLHANKSNLIRRLLSERAWQRSLIKQQETEIAILLDGITEARDDLQSEKSTRLYNEQQLQERIKQLEKRNADLSSSLHNVTGLRDAKLEKS
ncbi:hypothetical protein SBC1_26970 [Caballeronia sp. SBC1]|uniref:hypothetical protein n=1 Tax=Caballeronia sp. SBC1 TaxID=2705548 RepID=UPI00140E4108|nr:hypothetical protein [Caballeronia sp. SBC1]QIN62681.1 hypothetical protein SBC1_26970 [Caballeronia sp. SBC1]